MILVQVSVQRLLFFKKKSISTSPAPSKTNVRSRVYCRTKYEVPVCEVRCIVPSNVLMMGLVERSSSEAGQYPVESPGEIVPTVVLHRQPDVEQMEEDLADRVAAHHHDAKHGQHLLRDELDDAGVLSRQCERVYVHVMRLMEDLEEPGVSVHGVVHEEEGGVEHEQARKTLRARDEQRWRSSSSSSRALVLRESGVPDPRAHRQDAQRVLPRNPHEAAKPAAQADRLPVDPVPTDPRHARAEHIEPEEERREQDVNRESQARAPQRRRALPRALAYLVPDGLQQRSAARGRRNDTV